jgi:hypothetical protein
VRTRAGARWRESSKPAVWMISKRAWLFAGPVLILSFARLDAGARHGG